MSVGRRLPDIHWEQRTRGTAPYATDIALEGMLTARILRSPHPHAQIRSIDTSRAKRSPGVAAVVTAADFPDRLYLHEIPDRYPLARDVVRFVGQEVAAVAAETLAQADAALGRIDVRYRLLPAVTTVEEALAPRAPLLHKRRSGTNVSLRIGRTYGELQGGIAMARATRRERYLFRRQAHASMEPNGSVAAWDEGDGSLHLWTSTQSPYFVRKELAYILGLEPDRVRVHEVAVGGGFGAKSKITDHEVIAARLAMKAGRPVRLVLSREEEFATTKSRHQFMIDLETGVDEGGRLTHRRADVLVDNGAHNHSGPSVTGAAVGALASMYRTRGVEVVARLVDTNKNPGGQFRGYGTPQALFAIESQMDELAEELGVDPIDLRILNANQTGDVTHAGWRLASARLVECLEAVREAIGWDEKRSKGGRGRGVGVAAAIHVTGARTYENANQSAAAVDVRGDGTVEVRFGGADPGTGQRTILAQIAAEELGVDLERVEVRMMDTDATTFDLGAWSSRGTFMGGHAVAAAARTAAGKLKELASEKLAVDPGDVVLADGSARAGDDTIPLEDLVRMSSGDRLSVEETFTVDTELVDRETGVADISPTYSFAAHAAEVEVDLDTGKIRVLDYVATHDAGVAINPLAVEGQIIGGVVMGLGAALGEELIDEGGRVVNPAYINYALPRAADVPTVRPIVLGLPDPRGPYGAKSVGEISLNPVPAVIANAVAHATGRRIREIPLTPDRVLAAIRGGLPRDLSPLWRRPSRWWIHLVRWLYPRGLHTLLHRWGTRLAKDTSPRTFAALECPATVEEATVRTGADSAFLGGGTDLLPAFDQGLARAERLIDVTSIPALRRVEEGGDGRLEIGAGVTLAELARTLNAERDPAIVDTVARIASQQIREMATVGGNLLQQKRCWFYRNGFTCYKRAGITAPCYAVLGDNRFYHAILGAHRCQAVTPSDLATTFGALDAVATVTTRRGTRRIPVLDLYTGPGETLLGSDDLLVSVEITGEARARTTRFAKMCLWEGDFAITSVCSSLRFGEGGRVEEARVVLGSVAPTPWRARAVEERITGRRLGAEVIREASGAWTGAADPLQGNAWKVDATSALIRRVLHGMTSEREEA